MDIKGMREEYGEQGISVTDIGKEPFSLFNHWLTMAIENKLSEPNAFSLSTVDASGYPRSRTLLLKSYDELGFVFYTNYLSKKGLEIQKNPKVCLLFTWLENQKQVLICGNASKVSPKENQEYFSSRPRGSQIGAWASNQSSVVESRKYLDDRFAGFEKEFENREVPLPKYWGGYRVEPVLFEFWSGRKNRMHDRFQFSKELTGEWLVERLSP